MLTGPGRRRLHRAIGAALADPDQAAWHLARSADEPDETLAERAEQAARQASTRGAAARAAELAQAAAELSPDPESLPAWQRRISWLERLVAAGEFEQVRRLGEKWAVGVPAALRGRLTALRASVETDLEAACGLFAEAFTELAGRDPARAATGRYRDVLLHRHHQGGWARPAPAWQRSSPRHARPGNPVVLRQALAAAGVSRPLAGEPNAGDQLREAVRLPGFTDTPFPYEAPETVLVFWHLWRGELGSGPGPAAGGDRCRRAARVRGKRRSFRVHLGGRGVARGQLGCRRRIRRRECPLGPGEQPRPGGTTGLRRLARRGGPRQSRARPRSRRRGNGPGRSPGQTGHRRSLPVGAGPGRTVGRGPGGGAALARADRRHAARPRDRRARASASSPPT